MNQRKDRLLTDEQHEYFVQIQKGRYAQEVADLMNEKYGLHLKASQVKTYRSNHHFNSGLNGWFEKGQVPNNKGQKQIFNSDQARLNSTKTRFQQGSLPHNTCPIGTKKILADGYMWVKIDCQRKVPKRVNWKQEHILVWEQANGPLPKGYVVYHINGDPIDNRLENLIAVKKGQSAT